MRNLYWGFILIALGILLLLDNLGVADFGDMIHDYWPLLLIFWGLGLMFRRRSEPRPQQAAAPEHTSAGASDPASGSPPSFAAASEQASGPPPPFTGSSRAESDLIHQSSVFGDIMEKVTSPHFRGGSVSTVFGSSHLDCSSCGLADGEHELRIHGVFGDSKLTLPRNVPVAISASSVFGELLIFGQRKGGFSSEIQHVSADYPQASSRLKVSITRVFGRISVE